jgi:hypothetical protein
MRLLSTRRRKALTTLAVCSVAGLAGLVFATVLGDIEGESSGKIGSVTRMVFSAGPAPAEVLLPGGSAPASIRATNDSGQPQYIVSVANAPGNFHPPGSPGGQSPANPYLFVNPHAFPTGIEVPPGTTDILLPNTFTMAADAPLADLENLEFGKLISVRVASTPSG